MAVIGAGSYGTALAMLLARNGVKVSLWARSIEHVSAMNRVTSNERYLSGLKFPQDLIATHDLQACLEVHDNIMVVVPSHAFRNVIQSIKPWVRKKTRIVSATKGLDPQTGMFLLDVAEELLGKEIPKAILSGPTFAKELAKNLPTATTLASTDSSWLNELTQLLHNDYFRVYTSNDVVGVQLCGAVKNIIAVGAGMADGLGFGANARTALITRGIAELTRLGLAVGGQKGTFSGMAGLGDLVLTCTDNQSRNRRFGLAVGQGISLQEAERSIGQVVEAVGNAKEVYELAERYSVEMPIVEQIYRVLYHNMQPDEAAKNLMTRALKPEL